MATEFDRYEEPRRGRGFGRTLLLLLLAFVLGIVATGYAATRWQQVAAFLDRNAQPAATAQPQPLAQAAVPEPLTIEQAPLPDSAVENRLASLEQRVEKIDTRTQSVVGNADRAEALLVAFAARRALDRGADLGYIEALLRDRFGAAQPRAVATIISAARQPVTLDALQQQFDTLAPQLIGPGPNASWWDGVRRELANLIVLRRVDQPSTQPDDRLDRARSQLAAGQVDLALNEVTRLPGRDAAADWMAKARRYVLARSALDLIETSALLQPNAPAAQPAPAWPAPRPATAAPQSDPAGDEADAATPDT